MTEETKETEVVEQRPEESSGGIVSAFGGSFVTGLGWISSGPVINRPASRFWKWLAHTSLYNYHNTHGGDRTGLEQFPNGKIKLTPVKWKPMELCDDNEAPGWKVKGRDKTYKPTTFGQTGPRLGKVPVIPLDNQSWKATNYAEATIAEAIDQGEHRPLYDVSKAELSATIDARGSSGQMTGGSGVSADGGMDVTGMQFNPRDSPIFKDYIIELGGGRYDGRRAVSFWKAKEMLNESTTTEEMAAQEERGFLAGRSNNDWKSWAFKVILVAGAIAIAGLIGKELVGTLLGGGGGDGGGGGIIPFMLSTALAL